MKSKIELTWLEVRKRAAVIHDQLKEKFGNNLFSIYGIPRGGWMAAMLVKEVAIHRGCQNITFSRIPELASVCIDDIVDSGATRTRYGGKPFYALVDKPAEGINQFVIFPWETDEKEGPTENVRRLIEFIGDDPNREGLKETPDRVIRSYKELFSGYGQKPEDVIKVFEDGACDEMVIARGIEFVSFCEHHMLPFLGTAHIAYIPNGKVIGVSKLVRLLEIYARRLQIQERLCQQVTKSLDDHLKPKGSACILTAKHLCMSCRGVGKQRSEMVTSSLTGVFREQGNMARQELLSMIR